MISFFKKITAWLDFARKEDQNFCDTIEDLIKVYEGRIKEKDMIIASKDREIEELRARNRELMKRK